MIVATVKRGRLWFGVALLLLVIGTGLVGAQQAEITLFEDVFAAGLGHWDKASANWAVGEGNLSSDPVFVSELEGGHPEWQDIDLEFALQVPEPFRSSGRIQLLFRWQGEWHGYGLVVTEKETQFVRFEGGPRQLQVLARANESLPIGQDVRLRVHLQGRRMTAYIDGRPIVQAMDPVNTHPHGKIGLRTEGIRIDVHRVRIGGSPGEPVLDSAWVDSQSELDQLLAGFPPMVGESGRGFFPPSASQAGEAENIMLVYTHGKSWTYVDALPYVAYGTLVRERGALPRLEWHDWFFDTFLFLSLLSPDDKRAYDSATRGAPATWEDWMGFKADLFRPDAQLAAFNEAVAEAKGVLDDPTYRAKVIVMIPYPATEQVRFGDPLGTGVTLNFSLDGQSDEEATEARLTAVTAFVDGFMGTWETAGYEHLELIGFYWLAELVHGVPGERELIGKTAEAIQGRGLRFFWIPYYTAAGFSEWEQLGFDAAVLQPNYMFNSRLPRNRLADAATMAYQNGLGIEIEADGTVLNSASGRQRYLDYLWGGIKYGYMKQALKAYYQGHDVLGRAFMSSDPEVRAVYDYTYLFAKGILGKEETER